MPDRETGILQYAKEAAKSAASFYFLLEVRMVKINGEELNIAGKTITEYLAATNYDPKRIAVERNGDIVPKAKYGETILQDGDNIEIVSFVGGG